MKTKRSFFYAALFGMIALLTFSCKKEEKPEVTLTLNKTTMQLIEGESQEITAVVTNSTENVAWTSANPNVATVGATGNVCKVTAVAAGETQVKATVGGKEAVCTVKVLSKEFQLDKTSLTVAVGAAGEVNAINAEADLQWSTDPADVSAIATVAFAGTKATVTGVAKGTFKILARSGNKAVECAVEITDTPSTDHPNVDPTAGMFTVAFKVPELECYGNLLIDFHPGSINDDDPVAEAINDPNYPGWYKVVIPAEDVKGKLCPRQKSAAGGTWNYQASGYTVIEGDAEDVDDYGRALSFGSTALGATVYVEVTAWAADPCNETNPAGTASFNASFEIPDGVAISDIKLTVEGMGDGQPWKELAELSYDEDIEMFTATADVPASCMFKFVISYKGGKNVYQDGDNNAMPVNLTVNMSDIQWGEDPWVEPAEKNPAGDATFTVELGLDDYDVTGAVIVGNFDEESGHAAWDPADGLALTKGTDGKWTASCHVPAAFTFKVLASIGGSDYSWEGPGLVDPNQEMAVDLNFVKTFTIEDWQNLPAGE